MTAPLRILVVEDSEDDANINVRMLERGGFSVDFVRVEAADTLRAALAAGPWDAVLADYHMPGFTGLDALEIVRGSGLDLPFILVSGALGEEGAVAVMTAGASDYVMKGQLGRLPQVLARELEKAAARRAERDAQRRLQLVIDNVPAMIAYVDAGYRLTYANLRYRTFYAGSEESVEGRRLEDVLTPEAWQLARPDIERALAGAALSYSGERRLHDGSLRHVAVSLVPDRDEAGVVRGVYTLALDITGQHEAEMALRESEAGLRRAQEMARIAHVLTAADGSYVRTSESWLELIGADPARQPRSTRDALARVHEEDRERFRAAALEAARTRRVTQVDYRWRRDDGRTIHLRQTMEPVGAVNAEGRSQWFVTVQDATAQKLAEERIRRLNRVYAVLSGINGALVRIRDRQEFFEEACRIAVEAGGFRFAWICAVDEVGERLVPRATAGEVGDFLERIGSRLSLRDDAPDGHGVASLAVREGRAQFVNDVENDPLIRDKGLHHARALRSVAALPITVGGKPVAALGLHSPEPGFFDAEEQRLLLELAGDIAFALEHLEKEERVRHLAYFDQLTGLANRALFHDRLAQQLAGAARDGEKAALVLVNIGRFKSINDAQGRQVGDALLRQVAARLVQVSGDESQVARIGADQFAVLVPRVRHTESFVRRLEEANLALDGAPYFLGNGIELRISTRAGVALYPDDGGDADALFRNAEAAAKKAAAGDRFLFYTPKMSERVSERLQLENSMRLALEHAEFVLHYQPKVSLETQRITGAEVLIRWDNPQGGLVPPMDFVPLLEETGLIAEVGQWALERAIADHVRWKAMGLATPRVAVNVSAVQLRRADFLDSLKAMLAKAGGDPGIDLEITETLLMSDLEENIVKLRAIRDLGVNIVVDDFGTGYSSLAYLARLPAAAVKIDRSFVQNMTADADAMTLVATIVSLGHSLRLKVIAEGVENQAQADYLRVMRCDEVQGYFFGRPVPAADFERLLKPTV